MRCGLGNREFQIRDKRTGGAGMGVSLLLHFEDGQKQRDRLDIG